MARDVYIGGDPLFVDALARRLRTLCDDGIVRLLGNPEIPDEKLERLRASGGELFFRAFAEDVDRADIVVLGYAPSDLDLRRPSGRIFEHALDRHNARRATLLVVPMRRLSRDHTRLKGALVAPSYDVAWSDTQDPEGFLDQVVQVVRELAEPKATRINHLRLRGITVFDDVDLDFSPGINVLLGRNSTGKTHIMKVLYAALYACEQLRLEPQPPAPESTLAKNLAIKLIDVFKPAGDLNRILRRGGAGQGAALELSGPEATISARIDETGSVALQATGAMNARNTVFIPNREGLSLYEYMPALYKRFQLAMDGTYNDLWTSLGQPLRHEQSATLSEGPALRSLEATLGGKLQLKNGSIFVVTTRTQGDIEANLLAEGLRKIATLVRLLQNGVLTKDSILFWDEPEANLNPTLVRPLIAALQALAAQGVQIFVATHDYLFAYRLSLAAEYNTVPDVSYRFFSFMRSKLDDPASAVEVETGDTMADLTDTPILDEFAAYYDDQTALLAQSLRRERGGDHDSKQ